LRLHQPQRKRREADLISLINIVFLMLIFFLVASTLRPFALRDLSLAQLVSGEPGIGAAGYVIVHRDGALRHQGDKVTLEDLVAHVSAAFADAGNRPIAIVADHRATATRLIDVANVLQAAGFHDLKVVTRRARR
jgi:biopolymer transport protein ExbD